MTSHPDDIREARKELEAFFKKNEALLRESNAADLIAEVIDEELADVPGYDTGHADYIRQYTLTAKQLGIVT